MQTVAASLIEICQQARNLFLQEPRLIRLNTPTYILGDLHGNFSDLVCFEKVLWRMGNLSLLNNETHIIQSVQICVKQPKNHTYTILQGRN